MHSSEYFKIRYHTSTVHVPYDPLFPSSLNIAPRLSMTPVWKSRIPSEADRQHLEQTVSATLSRYNTSTPSFFVVLSQFPRSRSEGSHHCAGAHKKAQYHLLLHRRSSHEHLLLHTGMSSSGRDGLITGSTNGLHQRLQDFAEEKASAYTTNVSQQPSTPSLHKVFEAERQSGAGTPVPEDAPPSVKAASVARQQIREAHKRRAFPTINYAARVSHFDPDSDYRDFRGFFVLFWIGLGILVITTMLRNVKETGYPFVFRQRQLFVENIFEMAVSDAAMATTTLLTVPLHKLYASSTGWLRWKKGGVWVQTIFQAAWLVYWVE
jgi:hypothetical protein